MVKETGAGGYMLCTSPRSGSTLLCDILSRTGVAGLPESYLRPASISGYATKWRVPTRGDAWTEDYLKAIRHHSSLGTGGSALRIMWSDMPAVLDRLQRIAPKQTSDVGRFQQLLGIEHFVYLRREDQVAEAVSLVIASQTGLWHRNADGSEREGRADQREPIYDSQQIAAMLRMLEVENQGWETWFRSQSISPTRLTYEDLAADPAGAAEQVLKTTGRPVQFPLPAPGTARLATPTNEKWAVRFRRQTGRLSAVVVR